MEKHSVKKQSTSYAQKLVEPALAVKIILCITTTTCNIIVEKFRFTLTYNFALVHKSLQAFIYAQLKVSQQHFNQVEFWTLTWPLQQLDFFSFPTILV